MTKVEEDTIKLEATVPQFGSRLPKQLHIPRNAGLQRHSPTRLLLSHRAKPTNTNLRSVSNNFFLHLFYLHIPTVCSFPKVILTPKLLKPPSKWLRILKNIQKRIGFYQKSGVYLCRDYHSLRSYSLHTSNKKAYKTLDIEFRSVSLFQQSLRVEAA